MTIPSPFPWLWCRQTVEKNSRNLGSPQRVADEMTRRLLQTLRQKSDLQFIMNCQELNQKEARVCIVCRELWVCACVCLCWAGSCIKDYVGGSPDVLQKRRLSRNTMSFHPNSRAWLPISSNGPSWLVSEASSSHAAGRPPLVSTATCPSDSYVRHCGHLMPMSQVSHTTAPASSLTCLHVCTSCCSLFHLHIHTPSAQKSVATMETSSSTSKL